MGDETYVYPTDEIKETILYADPVPVPGSPRFTEGILNVRGSMVAALSSRVVIGVESTGFLKEDRIIIFEMGKEQFGVSMDSVGDIITFQSDQVA
ncbi:chemotaxis protein CheW [Microbulbifer spongiae]|uniref:Chemotaxis protein CheW n=1 Tax=Microbulbifer spongiae TaxID=2944933 RepID=A0ABY9E7S2_9GAMM|nr:chemotaxis protein CheW [Microbulbifer sp. MI-G]WKD49089.1 chemotaxis protein CheW [Microbulbifer sp. MI-G]